MNYYFEEVKRMSQYDSAPGKMGTPKCEMGTPNYKMETPKCEMGTPKYKMGTPKCEMGTPNYKMGTPKCEMGTPNPYLKKRTGAFPVQFILFIHPKN